MTLHAPRPLVVCVDDEQPVLSALKRVLAHEPYELLTTDTPAGALDLVARRNVRLLISDQRMPGMLGSELIQAVRSRSPGTACVLLTAFADSAAIIDRDNIRIQRLIMKPWDDADLRRAIREILGFEKAGLETRIDCKGRAPTGVLAQVLPACSLPEKPGRREVIVLENLGLLEGSISKLLIELIHLVEQFDARIELRDAAGYAETLLSAIGGAQPFVVGLRGREERRA